MSDLQITFSDTSFLYFFFVLWGNGLARLATSRPHEFHFKWDEGVFQKSRIWWDSFSLSHVNRDGGGGVVLGDLTS